MRADLVESNERKDQARNTERQPITTAQAQGQPEDTQNEASDSEAIRPGAGSGVTRKWCGSEGRDGCRGRRGRWSGCAEERSEFRERAERFPLGSAFGEDVSRGIGASFTDPLAQLVCGNGAVLPAIGSDDSIHEGNLVISEGSVKSGSGGKVPNPKFQIPKVS
jgi:hypothetical protein